MVTKRWNEHWRQQEERCGSSARDGEQQRDEEGDHHDGERNERVASVGDGCQHVHVASSLSLTQAGPYQGGAVPPVRMAFRFFSARSSRGRWRANPMIDAARKAKEYIGTLPLSW